MDRCVHLIKVDRPVHLIKVDRREDGAVRTRNMAEGGISREMNDKSCVTSDFSGISREIQRIKNPRKNKLNLPGGNRTGAENSNELDS